MSNDNKTLADVQPGGRVRLGDAPWPEIDAILADAYSAGAEGLPFEGIARRAAVRKAVAALSAQPSPGGQGDAPPCWWIDHGTYGQITQRQDEADAAVNAGKRVVSYVARQPVGEHGEGDEFLAGICVALQCVTAQDSGVLWAEIVRAVGVDDLLQYATFIEPEEWDLAGFSTYASIELGRRKPRSKASKQAKRPPAQAVDLGEIIEQIAQQWDGCSYDAVGETIDVGQAIRAAGKRLIDSQAVGNG